MFGLGRLIGKGCIIEELCCKHMYTFYQAMVSSEEDLAALNSDDAFVKLMEESGLTVLLTVSISLLLCVSLNYFLQLEDVMLFCKSVLTIWQLHVIVIFSCSTLPVHSAWVILLKL